MADFNIFGETIPSGMVSTNGEADSVTVGTAFSVGVADRFIKGVRLFVPADSEHNFTNVGAGIYSGGTQLVAKTFPAVIPGQWNTVLLDSSIPVTQSQVYKVVSWFPAGGYGVLNETFTAPVVSGDITATGAFFNYQPQMGEPSNAAVNNGWYGVDVIISDDGGGDPGGPGYELPDPEWAPWPTPTFSTVTISGTATDVLGAVDTDAATQTLSGSSLRTVRRSMWEDRTRFTSLNLGTADGPNFVASTSREVGLVFRVQRKCRIPSVRIYKNPEANGTVLVNFWTFAGVKMASTSVEWVADAGGWREIPFDTAILLEPGPTPDGPYYVASYHVESGHISHREYVYQEMEFFEWPFVVDIGEYGLNGRAGSRHSTIDHSASVSMFPAYANEGNVYIDPVAEYEEELPGEGTFPEFMDQFPNFRLDDGFLMGVYYPEEPYLQGYMDIGVTLGVGIPGESGYRDPLVNSGMNAFMSNWGTAPELFAGDPAFAERVIGYTIWDEPDMVHNPGSPEQIWARMQNIRRHDSTRPVDLNLGMWPAQSISYQWWPVGGNVNDVTPMWHEFGEIPDVLSCDWYNITSEQGDGTGNGTSNNPFGIWTYPKQVQKMRQLSKGRLPIWAYIETAPIVGGSWPSPDQVKRATWACIIAGATGIVFFDHQFADNRINGGTTADAHWMLNNPAMGAGVTELCAEVKGLTDPIYSPEVELITSVTSSNTTAGPKGNVHGVPIHHTERTHGGYRYAFVQAIRPGATTATFTAPTAAGRTLTVLGESRTVTADGSGVFSDSFSDSVGDGYEYHIYRWAV